MYYPALIIWEQHLMSWMFLETKEHLKRNEETSMSSKSYQYMFLHFQ